jgi:hypothetical protein
VSRVLTGCVALAPADYGGMQWYVDTLIGTRPGYNNCTTAYGFNATCREYFYTDGGCRAAYKSTAQTLVNRVNTVSGAAPHKADMCSF